MSIDMQEFWVDSFCRGDAEAIWEYEEKAALIDGNVPKTELIQSYLSPGSLAATLKMMYFGEELPVCCGGIVNMKWGRGEAWFMDSPLFQRYLKNSYRAMKIAFAEMVERGEFRRVQAISYYDDKCTLFKHLGFTFEAVLRRFGPKGEDGIMYSLLPDCNGG